MVLKNGALVCKAVVVYFINSNCGVWRDIHKMQNRQLQALLLAETLKHKQTL